MLPDFLALQRENAPRLRGKVVLQKFAEVALADEADARGVLLFCRCKAVILGDAADFLLFEVLKREEDVGKLLLRELI